VPRLLAGLAPGASMTAVRRGRAPLRPDAEALARASLLDAWTPTHRQLEVLVDDVASGLHWRIHAIHDSRSETWAADSGWPDRFLLRGGRAVAIEIKVPPDDLSAEQRDWLEQLNEVAGISAIVFRSCGWPGRDMAVLAELLQ
jgi:hypothetical protein